MPKGLKPTWALFDDEKVRDEAKARGMSVKGTLGVIVEAYRAGVLGFNDVENTIEAIMTAS